MFELADRLVGIYKTHNVTKSVTINPKEFSQQQQKAKASCVPLVVLCGSLRFCWAYSIVACLGRMTIDHASLARRRGGVCS